MGSYEKESIQTNEKIEYLENERPLLYQKGETRSKALWEAWPSDAKGDFEALPAMVPENHQEICEQLFSSIGLKPELYEDEETGLRGWEFPTDFEPEQVRGVVMISGGWRAPEWFAAELVKELNDQGFHVMVSALPGFGMNYPGVDRFEAKKLLESDPDNRDAKFISEYEDESIDENQNNVGRFGHFLTNYKENILNRVKGDLPVIQMPMSLSSRAITQFMVDEKIDVGDAMLGIEMALKLEPGADYLSRMLNWKYFGDRIFSKIEEITRPLGYKYEGLAKAMQDAAVTLGEATPKHLIQTMKQFYVDLNLPDKSIKRLIESGKLIRAISGREDDAVNLVHLKGLLGGLLKLVNNAPHSMETVRAPNSNKSCLIENLGEIIPELIQFADNWKRL